MSLCFLHRSALEMYPKSGGFKFSQCTIIIPSNESHVIQNVFSFLFALKKGFKSKFSPFLIHPPGFKSKSKLRNSLHHIGSTHIVIRVDLSSPHSPTDRPVLPRGREPAAGCQPQLLPRGAELGSPVVSLRVATSRYAAEGSRVGACFLLLRGLRALP